MLSAINIGELDIRLRIESASYDKDPVTNQKTPTWSELKTVWASELKQLSSEKFEARQQVARDEVRFFVRSSAVYGMLTADNTLITADSSQITADMTGRYKIVNERMRVIRRGEILYINSIEGSGRRGFCILKTEKRDNG